MIIDIEPHAFGYLTPEMEGYLHTSGLYTCVGLYIKGSNGLQALAHLTPYNIEENADYFMDYLVQNELCFDNFKKIIIIKGQKAFEEAVGGLHNIIKWNGFSPKIIERQENSVSVTFDKQGNAYWGEFATPKRGKTEIAITLFRLNNMFYVKDMLKCENDLLKQELSDDRQGYLKEYYPLVTHCCSSAIRIPIPNESILEILEREFEEKVTIFKSDDGCFIEVKLK